MSCVSNQYCDGMPWLHTASVYFIVWPPAAFISQSLSWCHNDKEKKRKVKFKVWGTGITHRWKSVCCSASSPCIQCEFYFAIFLQITFGLGISADSEHISDSSCFLWQAGSTRTPTAFLYLWLHLCICRGEYFLLWVFEVAAQLYLTISP